MNGYIHYKNYIGSVEFSEADSLLHGRVIGIKPLISFEGDTVEALTQDFHDAVDDYEAFCKTRKIKPEKSYKGSFNVRIGPDLHRKAVLSAPEQGISLNSFVENAVRRQLAQRPADTFAYRQKAPGAIPAGAFYVALASRGSLKAT
jgi:predicted HicB family RNase H-like nuclease